MKYSQSSINKRKTGTKIRYAINPSEPRSGGISLAVLPQHTATEQRHLNTPTFHSVFSPECLTLRAVGGKTIKFLTQ
ncbi:MAG: hypothetical protein LUG18_13115 [Candidatus Azobacteroides sp.]|nr:hypothetical protein [Candidatus Azobacteroides sp.]